MNMYYYYLNVEVDKNWNNPTICNYGFMKNLTMDNLRNMKDVGYCVTERGWHFSYIGTADKIKEKIEAYSHQEFNNSHVKNMVGYSVNNLQDLFQRPGMKFEVVKIDEAFPRYIRDNQEKLKEMIRRPLVNLKNYFHYKLLLIWIPALIGLKFLWKKNFQN
jgi:beta-1,4-mannosyl-glycoprotein beta-1,4-N-acetylglucosaminyltransferase